jgi:inward rectifier potassium channel
MAFRPKFIQKLVKQESERNDLGFGKQLIDSSIRLINHDGTFNVKRKGGSFWGYLNIFHRLITTSWQKFLLLVFCTFLVINFMFAGLYWLIGTSHLIGLSNVSMDDFWGAFFFSAQTLTTVGYGHIAPSGLLTSAVAALESLLGLLGFALATGLLYGRFSRPQASILFSRVAVVAPYLDTLGLMFRVVNERSNQLIECQVEVSLTMLEDLPDGRRTRKYYNLYLERSKVAFFPLNWTLVHAITSESPLFGRSPEELLDRDAELLILFKGVEDTFSQMVHARGSYRANEVVWGAKFVPMYDSTSKDIVELDIEKLNDYEFVPLVTEIEQVKR